MNKTVLLLCALLAGSSLCMGQPAQTPDKGLAEAFQNPPAEARPRVWWHWMNGNITQDGIRKDLLWMKRAGIAGFQVFDAGMATPQIVEKRLAYMTPEWKDAFACATHLADSLGLEMTISSSPGWSLMGGPWVSPEDGMKKLTWRETIVDGNGKQQTIALPKPFDTTGPFQNKPIEPNLLLGEVIPEYLPSLYKDIKVLAMPASDEEYSLTDLGATLLCAGKQLDLRVLTDGDLSTTLTLPIDSATGKAVIDIALPKEQTFRSLYLCDGRVRPEFDALKADTPCRLLVCNDKNEWKEVLDIPSGGAPLQTASFPETTGRHFRLEINRLMPDGVALMLGLGNAPLSKEIDIAEFNLMTTSRVNHSEEKTGFMATMDVEDFPTPITRETFPSTQEVVDLTDKLQPDGSLQWEVPKGKWRIIRFGYSLTGKRNHPASPEATGLEIDKLDKEAWKRYFTHYLNMYKDAANGLMGQKGIQYMVTDSYESGASTWTTAMPEEFQKRRGYELEPWMPVLAGYILESAEASERFLWDWRKTISELIAENYDLLTKIIQKDYGMKGRYTESHEHGRLYMADGMDVKRTASIPMAAIWGHGLEAPRYDNPMTAADVRESASVAHIYGQNIVAAESFTVVGYPNKAWNSCPESLKPFADFGFANGLNRIVVHTSPHQPTDTHIPGLSLTAVGQWFDRHDTWAEQASVWTDYIARSCYLLQQGHFAADIVYYYGEDNNISALFGHHAPDIPQGYNFDYINPDALVNLLQAKDGKLITPSGMSYRVLVLDKNVRRMSMPVLRKIAQLADAGAIICGAKPEMPASLADDKEEFYRLIKQIWHSGKPNVTTGIALPEVLTTHGITPDATFATSANSPMRFVHRTLGNEGDIYWISNPAPEAITVEASLRVMGRCPMLYNPENGEISPVSYHMSPERTLVELNLAPNDAIFIVFTQKTDTVSFELPKTTRTTLVSQFPTWDIAFQAGRGAPATIQTDTLRSYTESADPGIRYFSGTAAYTNTFTLGKAQLKNCKRILLELDDVKNLAEVYVNGQKITTLWKRPFTADITRAVKAGKNRLEVRVTNLWPNRLIGDEQPDVTKRITYVQMPFYQVNAPLLPSGLLGPVSIVGERYL